MILLIILQLTITTTKHTPNSSPVLIFHYIVVDATSSSITLETCPISLYCRETVQFPFQSMYSEITINEVIVSGIPIEPLLWTLKNVSSFAILQRQRKRGDRMRWLIVKVGGYLTARWNRRACALDAWSVCCCSVSVWSPTYIRLLKMTVNDRDTWYSWLGYRNYRLGSHSRQNLLIQQHT